MMGHVPNLITLGRLIAVPITVYCILIGQLEWAFWLFIGAGISDAVDGAIARLFNARTVLGAFLDPLADKALLVSVYLSLARDGLLPLWLVILVVFRDLMIVGWVLLAYTLRQPVTMQPLRISKVNTLAQLVLAAAVLAACGPGLPNLPVQTYPMLFGWPLDHLLEALVAATTVLSGVLYLAYSDLLTGGGGNRA